MSQPLLPLDPESKENAAFNAYLDALRVVGRCSAEIYPPLGNGVHETLLRLRRRLAFDPRSQAQSEAHEIFESTVRDFGRRAKEALDRQSAEAVNLLALATQTADLIAARDRSYLELLRDVTRKLQFVSTCEDPAVVRERCSRIAFVLTQMTETFKDDSTIALARFRSQLGEYSERKKLADEVTALDPVTGLFSRQETEHRMRQAIALGRQFCVLKLGLHEFSGFEDEHGEDGMRVLIKAAADKLLDQIRPRDTVGQWDSRTFLLLFYDCSIEIAELRAQQISGWLSGDYRLAVNGADAHADVQLTGAATEVRQGEPEDHFVARAEALSPVVITAGV